MNSIEKPALGSADRLLSLDAFRGLDMLCMLLVGSVSNRAYFPEQFLHRGWNDGMHGATFCDLIFPWFLFIVGAAIPFSMAAGRGKGRSALRRIAGAARRGFVLYLFGCLIHAARTNEVSLLTWDILQHIGVAYFVAVVVFHLPRSAGVAFVAVVLVGKWLMLRHILYPDVGEVLWTREQNLPRWLSDQSLGWFGGLFNVLPGAGLALIGTWAGAWLRRTDRAAGSKIFGLLAGSVLLIGVSWIWRMDLPYSKDFFTSSYVLLGAGTGGALLAVLYGVCDVGRWSRLMVFVIPGRNAITLYLTVGLLSPMVLHRWKVPAPGGELRTIIDAPILYLTKWWGGAAGAWLFTVLYISVWWLWTYWLYRRRLFLKV